MLNVCIENVGGRRWTPPPGMVLHPTRMTWQAQGGPDRARVAVRGSPAALAALFDLPGCPVTLADEQGEPCWWGYVSRAALQTGRVRLSADLERMANRVQVSYLRQGSELGVRADTPWAEDPLSQSCFGVKELRLQMGAASEEEALAARDSALAQRALPRAVPRLLDQESEPRGWLDLRGWFHTLTWRYAVLPPDVESNLANSIGTQPLGETGAVQAVAQQIQIAGSDGWRAERVRLKVRRKGSPTDALRVELCADASGVPGAVLSAAEISGSSLSPGYAWAEWVFSGRVSLLAGVSYWLVLRRTGGSDDAHAYAVDVDEGLSYPRGVLRLWDGSAWTARAPDADAVFWLGGVSETTRQMSALITSAGALFTGVDLQVASGIYAPAARGGDRSAQAELLDLLEGGSEGRLLATVTPGRWLRIQPAPAAGENDLRLHSSGAWEDARGNPLTPAQNPAGRWARLVDRLPGCSGAQRTIFPERFWVERAAYDGNGWTVTT